MNTNRGKGNPDFHGRRGFQRIVFFGTGTIVINRFMLWIAISAIVTAFMPSFGSVNEWRVGEKYLTLNGNPVFLNGVNYVPPVNWHTSYEDWNPKDIEADLTALKKIGVKCVRMFPLWPILQPEPGRVDPVRLERVVQFLDMAQKAGLVVQPAPITGWAFSCVTFTRSSEKDIPPAFATSSRV